jgi:hypothetical protein
VAGKKAALMASERLAARAASRAATVAGTKLATAAATSAVAGPFAPFVFIAELSFVGLSMGLDIGDAGGYMDMRTNNIYVDMKKDFDKKFNETILDTELDDVDENGNPIKVKLTEKDIPIIIGPPIPTKTDQEFEKYIDDGFQILVDNKDPILKPMHDKMIEDLHKGVITEKDLYRKDVEMHYRSYLDMKTVYEKIQNNYCVINNGKIILRNGFYQCSYKDKSSCENSYKWPLEQEENEEIPSGSYAEYKSNLLNGICILANPNLRSVCELHNLNYDTETGLCKVTRDYCLTKGAEWKDDDCHISTDQDIAEMIFGTTIIRGLKQVFDPDQYESCKEGEKDDGGYFCHSYGCGYGYEKWGELCYPKCKDGLEPNGCCLCGPKSHGVPAATKRDICPPGSYLSGGPAFDFVGVCRMNCPSDTDDVAAICYHRCKPGETDVFPALCREPCAEGYHEVLGVCWRNDGLKGVGWGTPAALQDCAPGQRDDGTSCWEDWCTGGYWNYTGGCGTELVKCWDGRTGCHGDCYRTWICNQFNGCGCIKKNKYERMYCKDSTHELNQVLGLCYPKCEEGYHKSTVNICQTNGALSYEPRSYAKTSFPAPGVAAVCPSYKQDHLSMCYENCAPGYKMTAAGRCTFDAREYPRGAGDPILKIRPKKRVIPFSTKDN